MRLLWSSEVALIRMMILIMMMMLLVLVVLIMDDCGSGDDRVSDVEGIGAGSGLTVYWSRFPETASGRRR